VVAHSWKIRRRVIFLTLAFCAWIVGKVLLMESPTTAHEAIATTALLLAGSVVGSYVFGATWDDKQ